MSSGGTTVVVVDAMTVNLVFLSGQTTLGIGESLLVVNETAAFQQLSPIRVFRGLERSSVLPLASDCSIAHTRTITIRLHRPLSSCWQYSNQ